MWTTMSFATRNSHNHSALGLSRKAAFRAVAMAGRHAAIALKAALANHLLDDRPTALFERVRVGHQRELAGIAISDLQVFVVQELEGLAGADLKANPAQASPPRLAIAGGLRVTPPSLCLRHGEVKSKNSR